MYVCDNCKYDFTALRTFDDTKGDESYDVCPRCGSENYTETPVNIERNED